MATPEVPESWRRWKRDPSTPPPYVVPEGEPEVPAYPEPEPEPDGRVRGLNYLIQAQNADMPEVPDITEEDLLVWIQDPANQIEGGGVRPSWMALTQEESAAALGADDPEEFGTWTTCLRHVIHNGRVCVCTRPSSHETDPLEDDGVNDPLHMDYNASVAWTSPDDVWDIQDPEPATWRDWFLTGTLDPRSLLVGLMGGLVVLVITLAAVFVKH